MNPRIHHRSHSFAEWLLAALVLTGSVFGVACNAAPKAARPPNGGDDIVPDHWTPRSPSDEGPGTLVGQEEEEGDGAVARRLSVDQLRRSIPALFGGITWTIPAARGNPIQQFDSLARTLGEADYLQATLNDLGPSPLFAKFMDDMAGDVCDKAIAADRANSDPNTRLLIRDATDVNANLRFLRLKFHGIWAEGEDGIQDLRRLYDEILVDEGEDSAWVGVCVAMLTAPEFMVY